MSRRRNPMAAYMRQQFEFMGVKTAQRRLATKPTMARARQASGDEVVAFARDCWNEPEREFQYVGTDVLTANVARLESRHLADIEGLITAKSWWDTVDGLAAWCVGGLVRDDRTLVTEMDRGSTPTTSGSRVRRSSTSSAGAPTPTPTGCSSTRSGAPTTPSSSSARRSDGRCVSTPASIPTPSGPSSRPTSSPVSPAEKPSNTSDPLEHLGSGSPTPKCAPICAPSAHGAALFGRGGPPEGTRRGGHTARRWKSTADSGCRTGGRRP